MPDGTEIRREGELRLWREALDRLRALERVWPDDAARERERAACRAWLAEQRALPRLAGLAHLLAPGLSLRQLDCVRVPIERAVARLRITDVEILDADLPPAAAPAAPPLPLTVVADSIRSAFNVGGLFRTAECFGVRELLLCGYTPPPDQAQAARAALGTERLVAWRHAGEIRAAIAELRAEGVPCVALETVAGAPSVAAFEWPFPCALVVGNERFGLDPDVVRTCDATVRIPLAGRKNSLNVVSALAVALFAATQCRQKRG
ncbi:MAG TPA: TrmH family RNA methyltransferase [Kiritimatiellia bacterium]|nr:MAG: tRNA (guanosine(18)-2'-O)-methyltransferase [Verrucomicrobia bacterium ADurb.Bin070]HQQ90607.1 TrmH family RNA methyltransferase [Kiritimatiellia bacterium]